jgi:hypothetical protein
MYNLKYVVESLRENLGITRAGQGNGEFKAILVVSFPNRFAYMLWLPTAAPCNPSHTLGEKVAFLVASIVPITLKQTTDPKSGSTFMDD